MTPKYAFVVQAGRLESECIILVESMLQNGHIAPADITAYYPKASSRWRTSPEPGRSSIEYLSERGIEIRTIDNSYFGERYPHANKIYAISNADTGPLIFLDTDVFFLAPPEDLGGIHEFSALRGGSTFPKATEQWQPRQIWKSLFSHFGLDVETNRLMPQHGNPIYPYCNAGVLVIPDGPAFGYIYLDTAIKIANAPIVEMVGQPLYPFLDQISLPIAIARMGGALQFLDPRFNSFEPKEETVVWHYHYMARLPFEGREKYGDLISSIIDGAQLGKYLPDDSPLRFWCSDQGRSLYATTIDDVGPGLTPLQLVHALKQRGGITR